MPGSSSKYIIVEMKVILNALDKAGVDIELFGDPKQDIRGHSQFRALIDAETNVYYLKECHRCPQKHLQLSNILATDAEKQVADANNKVGSIHLYFETEIDNLAEFIEQGAFGLKYIHQKNDRFATHSSDKQDNRFITLNYELTEAIQEKSLNKETELIINRMAYFLTEKMLQEYDAGIEPKKIVNKRISDGYFDYDKIKYAKICHSFGKRQCSADNGVVVNSIASIKGLESDKCLFILTRELAPYLFGDKTQEKATKHLLYVALTRSMDDLSILIAKEIEDVDTYTKEFIRTYLKNLTEIEE